MSLIHTCELNQANPFDPLTELQRHAEERSEARRRGCLGIIATPWRGSPPRPPRNMINPAWPEGIVCGRGGIALRKCRRVGLSNRQNQNSFWPGA